MVIYFLNIMFPSKVSDRLPSQLLSHETPVISLYRVRAVRQHLVGPFLGELV